MNSHRMMKMRQGMQDKTAPSELETGASIPCSAEALQNTTANPEVKCRTECG